MKMPEEIEPELWIYLSSRKKALHPHISHALIRNSQVFAKGEGGGVNYQTSRPVRWLFSLKLILFLLLCSIFRPTSDSIGNSTQIQSSSHKMIFHTWTILRTTASDHDDTMLLNIVALSRNIRRNHLPATQPYSCRLPFTRIWLFRLRDTSL